MIPRSQALSEQTLDTWQRLSHANQVPVVADWPLPGDPQRPVSYTAPELSEETSGAWLVLLQAMEELHSYRDRETLLRRAVELFRDVTGIARAALFLLEDDQHCESLRGTWGTSVSGATVSERNVSFRLGRSHQEAFNLAVSGLARWLVLRSVPLIEQTAAGPIRVAIGENVLVPVLNPLLGSDSLIGLFACDAANAAGVGVLREQQLVRAAVFSAHVGMLLAHHQGVREVGKLARAGSSASARPSELTQQALAQLRRTPAIGRDALAKQLGTSASRLGKQFKLDMGETLTDYRNQLRLERFFRLVDPGNENLLAAALAAGFGSYAQFHRVFLARVGCPPRQYCRRVSVG